MCHSSQPTQPSVGCPVNKCNHPYSVHEYSDCTFCNALETWIWCDECNEYCKDCHCDYLNHPDDPLASLQRQARIKLRSGSVCGCSCNHKPKATPVPLHPTTSKTSSTISYATTSSSITKRTP